MPTHVSSSDTLIRGGTVIDGTGTAGRLADVWVHGDRIAAVGDPAEVITAAGIRADRVIDAGGMVVTPGFIDAHAHGEPYDKLGFQNFLAMGVTTACFGQDGESPEEQDLKAWMDRIDAAKPGINIAMFVGHGTVRTLAGVGVNPAPDAEALRRMAALIDRAMEAGCFGLSTGLEYDPGRFAGPQELVAMARSVARRDGIVMSHMRSEDDTNISSALAELLAQGVGAGCAVHVSHMKVTFGRDPARVDQLFAQMETARRKGVRVTADVYPYNASHTKIDIVYPDWARPPADFNQVAAARRQDLRAYLRERINLRNGPQATLFTSPPWAGKTLAQVASELRKPFEDVLIDDIRPGSGASAAYFVIDEPLMQRILANPHVMISSDGSPVMLHPRGHGTFARVIRQFVYEKPMFSLEAAIHKMTGLTASTVRLDGARRGRIAPGFFADLLVFDPAAVRDTATFEQPHLTAQGIDTILVNGRIVRRHGQFVGERSGRVVRKLRVP